MGANLTNNEGDRRSQNERHSPTESLIGEALIAYEVAGDGSSFRMTFNCANGKPGSLSLPTECLHALIMTLPRMMTQALSAQYGDDSLRLVYPAETVRIERSPDPNIFITRLVTPDGFAVSFSLSGQQLRALSESGMNALSPQVHGPSGTQWVK